MHILHTFRSIIRTCAQALAVVAMISVAGMMLTITYDVFARSAFRAPTDWAYPLNALGVLCVTALPVPYLYIERKHIAMDLIHRALPTRFQTAANIVTAVAVGGFGVVVAVTAALSFPVAVDAGLTGSGTFNIPFWIHDGILIIAGVFLVLAAMFFPGIHNSGDTESSPDGNDEFPEHDAIDGSTAEGEVQR